MGYTTFVRIKDISTGGLWDTEDVYMMAKDFKLSGNVLTSVRPKSFQDTTLNSDDTTAGDSGSNYVNNYNRRKSEVSYSGFDNPEITIECIYNPDTVGASTSLEGVTRKIFSPSKLYELILKPRTIYIKDEVVHDLLSAAEDTSPKVYSTNGIPVILTNWDISPSGQGKEIIMSLTFQEDKGTTSDA